MFIKQISVFLENVRGSLRELTELLGARGIDLMALSVADSVNFGIVRCVVSGDQTDLAVETLKGVGYTARVTDVICVSVPDHPAGLAEVLKIIDDANISVEYLYSIIRQNATSALIVFKLSDPERGCKVLQESGVTVYLQEQIDTLAKR